MTKHELVIARCTIRDAVESRRMYMFVRFVREPKLKDGFDG